MEIGEMVIVKTGCQDCGDVPALVHDILQDNFYIEIIGGLPHSLKDKPNARWM